MIDVDSFKPYNDNYGHKAGDECLQTLAEVIQASFQRASDTVARYGGEEFAVLLADAKEDQVVAWAEDLCAKVRDLDIRHSYSPVAGCVTISIGVATTRPNPLKSPYSLVQTADRALYRAKRDGRDRVVVAGPH
jgi:diguanylate cyclase (GGDEF)-like protein